MPTISRFFGITIRMYFEDHRPPHFHAYYGKHEASITINSLQILGGKLPVRALRLAIEWATLHQDELRVDWQRAQAHQPLYQIDPLK